MQQNEVQPLSDIFAVQGILAVLLHLVEPTFCAEILMQWANMARGGTDVTDQLSVWASEWLALWSA